MRDQKISYELKKRHVQKISDALKEASFLRGLRKWRRRRDGSESGDSSETFSTGSEDPDCQEIKVLHDDDELRIGLDELSSASVDSWRHLSAGIVSDMPSKGSKCNKSESQSSDSESVSSGGSTGSYRRARRRRNRPRRDASGLAMTFWNADYRQRWRDRSDRHGNGRSSSSQSKRCDSSNEEFSEGWRSRDSRSLFRARH